MRYRAEMVSLFLYSAMFTHNTPFLTLVQVRKQVNQSNDVLHYCPTLASCKTSLELKDLTIYVWITITKLGFVGPSHVTNTYKTIIHPGLVNGMKHCISFGVYLKTFYFLLLLPVQQPANTDGFLAFVLGRWRSGGSIRLPPICLRFNSQTQH